MAGLFHVNSNYSTKEFKQFFFNKFRSEKEESFENEDGVKILQYPFACAMLPNFLKTPSIDALEAEARKFPLSRRLNDLFSLNQSDDLKTLCKSPELAEKFPLLSQLRGFFAGEMLNWMKDVTGAELDEGEVSSTISLYKPNDYLLCHDDELERRRIAFIIYLVPNDWSIDKDGGALDLYDCGPSPDNLTVSEGSGDYHPWRVVRSLSPQRNCLAFFEVCSRSFHQVAEVLGRRDRLSVHGWFMSDPLPRVPRSGDPVSVPRLPACFVEEELVMKWINIAYIDTQQQQGIKNLFIENSEIQLPQFFNKANWLQLCKAIASLKDDTWLTEGPMDLRNISVLPYAKEEASLPEECREISRLFHSEVILLLLSQLTGITLHPLMVYEEQLEQEQQPGTFGAGEEGLPAKRPHWEIDDVKTEITAPRFHRWSSGMYTLLADAGSGVVSVREVAEESSSSSIWRLDAHYHIGGYGFKKGSKNERKSATHEADGDSTEEDCWQESWNGQIIYVSRKDNEELLRIRPQDNSLTLVYGEASDTAKFVHYIKSTAKPLPLPGVERDTAAGNRSYAFDVATSYFLEQTDDEDDGDMEERTANGEGPAEEASEVESDEEASEKDA